ncbi:hypothetical protein BDA99DRAFT_497924, partial [Phascolomyces articulosus]
MLSFFLQWPCNSLFTLIFFYSPSICLFPLQHICNFSRQNFTLFFSFIYVNYAFSTLSSPLSPSPQKKPFPPFFFYYFLCFFFCIFFF